MSFSEFEQAIKSPALKKVALHWKDVCGSRTMPDWKDLIPSRIAPQLSIIWSYRYDRERDEFTGRIAGDQVEAVFGRTFRGTPMSLLYPVQSLYAIMFARFRRVVGEPALYLEEGKVFQLVRSYGYGERIAMPVAKVGKEADGLIGATVYEAFRSTDAQPAPDEERWFTI